MSFIRFDMKLVQREKDEDGDREEWQGEGGRLGCLYVDDIGLLLFGWQIQRISLDLVRELEFICQVFEVVVKISFIFELVVVSGVRWW